MRRLTILVDMDDVLDELLKHWVSALNKKCNTDVGREDITGWDIHPYFPTLSQAELYAPLKEESFWANMTPVDGATQYIEQLQKDGHCVLVVTATHYGTVKPKIKWLLNTFHSLVWEDIIITSHKQLIKGDVLVDDGIHNLEGGTYFKILMDAPHNRSYDAEANGMARTTSWKDAYRLISDIANT